MPKWLPLHRRFSANIPALPRSFAGIGEAHPRTLTHSQSATYEICGDVRGFWNGWRSHVRAYAQMRAVRSFMYVCISCGSITENIPALPRKRIYV
jgi:hypothetical protein